MTKKHSTKRALIASLLSLALCFTMLIGTTFAWFTDSATSNNNVIQSGTLDVAMYWADGTQAIPADEEGWTDASTGAIFNYDNWEPGYVEVRHIKIANEGSLALKYKVNIIANGRVSDLADVIDVYYVDPAIQVADRAALANAPKIGTLTEVLKNLGKTGNGTLTAGAADTITIALKMQEDAGNEYQGKSIGTDFSIQLLATQFTAEEDSFDDQYDKDAIYQRPDGTVPGDTSWYTEDPTAAEYTLSNAYQLVGLADMVNSGVDFTATTVKLDSDISLVGVTWTSIGSEQNAFNGTFDGCGYTIKGMSIVSTEDAAFFNTLDSEAVVKNLNFTDVNVKAKNAGVVSVFIGGGTVENVHVLSGTVEGTSYAAAFVGQQAFYGATIKDCTNYADVTSGFVAAGFGGYIWYDSTVEGCVNYGNITGGNRAGGIAAHLGGIIKNCTNNGEIISNGGMSAGGIVGVLSSASTIENCVNNGDVANRGEDPYNSNAGGILGVTPGSAVTIKNCVNNGDVTANNSRAAGIATALYGSVTAVECENNGDIYGALGAAGIATASGVLSGTNTVTDCIDNGSVSVG